MCTASTGTIIYGVPAPLAGGAGPWAGPQSEPTDTQESSNNAIHNDLSSLPPAIDWPTLHGVMVLNGTTPPPLVNPRADGRGPNKIRPLRFLNNIAPHATGSTLVEWGNTRVICGVTVEETVPRWMKEQGLTGGWITAEYSMLPYSTLQRKQRDSAKGKVDGRSQEIQRLIGRSLRAALDLEKIGPRTIWVDCDVLQADGGTRTAAITGAFVALKLAVQSLTAQGKLTQDPIISPVAAVSVGVVQSVLLVDLCYTEDVAASVDANLVMNGAGQIIELQASGEEATFSEEQLKAMLEAGKGAIGELLEAQSRAVALAQTP